MSRRRVFQVEVYMSDEDAYNHDAQHFIEIDTHDGRVPLREDCRKVAVECGGKSYRVFENLGYDHKNEKELGFKPVKRLRRK